MSGPPDPQAVDPRRVEELFAAGSALPAGEREAFLDRECDSPALRDAVASLLAASTEREAMAPLSAERAARLLAATERDRTPGTIGPYRVVRTLGEGGMGTVYLAERIEGGFEQQVALKLVKKGMDSDAIVARFRQERQILARLEHPGIARLIDGGVSEDGRPYFAMEYVEGETIVDFAEQQGIGVTERARLFVEVCEAVGQAHRSLVVHRDLKPSNILVAGDGRVKLVDFGIAKVLEPGAEPGDGLLTRLGMRVLTPLYSAPEQVRGEPVTTASDVYSLGVVLFELLTGRLPYRAPLSTPEQIAKTVCETEPVAASTAARLHRPDETGERLARRLRGDLDAIVSKALAKDPERRYFSVESFAEDLRRHLAGHPVRARPPGAAYRVRKFVRRHRLGVASVGAALIALFLGLGGTAWQAAVAAGERDRATEQAAKAEAVQDFLTSLLQSVDPYRNGGEPWTAEELLDRGVERIEAGVRNAPEVEADLLGVLGGVSRSLGQLERSEELWRRSMRIRRERFAPQSPEIAEGLRGLAEVLYERGEHDQTSRALEEALRIERGRADAETLRGRLALAKTLEQLGVERHELDRFDEARDLYEESLSIYRGVPGDHRQEVGGLLVNLADLNRAIGKLDDAVSLYRDALAIEREVLGPHHPGLAVTLGNLGVALQTKGDYDGAEKYLREALKISREALGEEHPEVSTKLNNLAVLLRSRGSYGEAAELFRKVLALDRKLLGPRHEYVAYSLDNLAMTLTELGQIDEALELFGQAREILLATRGAASVDAATNRAATAVALRLRGDAKSAVELLQGARDTLRAALPSGHPREARVVAELAAANADLGRDAEAESLYREALEMRRRAGQQHHPETVEALVGLGRLLVRSGRAAEALPLVEEAARDARATLPEGHWLRDAADLALAGALVARGEAERARQLEDVVAGDLTSRGGPRVERLRRQLDELRRVG